MLSLPLKLLIGGFAGATVAVPTAYAIKDSFGRGSSKPRVEPTCWLVMQGTDDKNTDLIKQLIVCKEVTEKQQQEAEGEKTERNETPSVKYYLKTQKTEIPKQEVESIKVTDGNTVTLTLVQTKTDSVPKPEKNQETMKISLLWNLGNDLNLNTDCKLDLEDVNKGKRKMTCPKKTPQAYKWLDPYY